ASTNTKMVYSDQPSHSSLITYTSAHSCSIMEDVLHSFVAENEPTQQLAYDDFEQLGHFSRECKVKKVDEKARYSAFKNSEVKSKEPKAMVSVDSMLNWNEHEAENKTEEGEQVYGLMAGFKSNFVDPAGNAAGSVYNAAAEFAMMGISPKKSGSTKFDLNPAIKPYTCSPSSVLFSASCSFQFSMESTDTIAFGSSDFTSEFLKAEYLAFSSTFFTLHSLAKCPNYK
nr:hypothetical protein [Tanacetum cinerariifolium]